MGLRLRLLCAVRNEVSQRPHDSRGLCYWVLYLQLHSDGYGLLHHQVLGHELQDWCGLSVLGPLPSSILRPTHSGIAVAQEDCAEGVECWAVFRFRWSVAPGCGL